MGDASPHPEGSADPAATTPPKDGLAGTDVNTLVGGVLDTIGEGVLVVGRDGKDRWMNARMKRWPASVHDQVRRTCAEAIRQFAGPTNDADRASRRYHIVVDDDRHFELLASCVRDATGEVDHVVAVIFDATATRRLRQKIDAIDKAGAELVKIESQAVANMTLAERLRLLEEKVIRATRDLMSFEHFNIRLVDPATRRLEPVLASGLPSEAFDVELYSDPGETGGISGYVASTGRSYICHDVQRDSRYVAGLDNARSSLTVPLTLDDQVVGVLNVESSKLGAFNEDDRQFAEIFGRHVAVALSILKLLVSERAATNKKVADDVAGEIAGPLNDIALDAGSLLDEFVGQEQLQGRLRAILDNVEGIRRSIADASQGPQKVLGARGQLDALAPDDEDSEVTPLRGARVLVVDDEPAIRDTVAAVLRKHRVEVTVETNGRNAIETLKAGITFDLVLSDIRMPDKSGYDVFSAARKLDRPPPVILMTGFGYDPNHCIVRASQEGLQAVLFKPFRVEQMLTEVRNAVATRDAASGDERAQQPAA